MSEINKDNTNQQISVTHKIVPPMDIKDAEYSKNTKLFNKYNIPEEDWYEFDEVLYDINSFVSESNGRKDTGFEKPLDFPSIKSIANLYHQVGKDIELLDLVLGWVKSNVDTKCEQYNRIYLAIKKASQNIEKSGFLFLSDLELQNGIPYDAIDTPGWNIDDER